MASSNQENPVAAITDTLIPRLQYLLQREIIDIIFLKNRQALFTIPPVHLHHPNISPPPEIRSRPTWSKYKSTGYHSAIGSRVWTLVAGPKTPKNHNSFLLPNIKGNCIGSQTMAQVPTTVQLIDIIDEMDRSDRTSFSKLITCQVVEIDTDTQLLVKPRPQIGVVDVYLLAGI